MLQICSKYAVCRVRSAKKAPVVAALIFLYSALKTTSADQIWDVWDYKNIRNMRFEHWYSISSNTGVKRSISRRLLAAGPEELRSIARQQAGKPEGEVIPQLTPKILE